jgi:uncharacterized delta-60 repeat protein
MVTTSPISGSFAAEMKSSTRRARVLIVLPTFIAALAAWPAAASGTVVITSATIGGTANDSNSPPGGVLRHGVVATNRVHRALRALLLAGVVAVVAASGPTSAEARARPDPTFGSGRGWVTTTIPGTTPIAYGAAVVQRGAIVLAGQTSTAAGETQIVVLRYLPGGRLDRGFGSRGVFTTALPQSDGPFVATAIRRQRSTGKLLIAGGYGQGSMLLLRLGPRGRLDRSFGGEGTGLVTTPVGGIAESLAIQRGGRILLGGSNANANGRPMVVARFTRNGVLDRGFGRGGLAQALFWNPNLAASAGVSGLATYPKGGVVASGHIDYIGGDGHGSAGVFRLSSSGRLVRGFGTSGGVEVAFTNPAGGFAQWFPCAMTVDSRRRITVTGDGSTAAGDAILTARMSRGGVLDSSFGRSGNGRVVLGGATSGSDTTCGAVSGASGNLIVGAGAMLAGLSQNGTPNRRFAPGGLMTIRNPAQVTINAVARSGRQRIVVAGAAGNALYVARYRLPTRSRRRAVLRRGPQ